MYIYTNTKECLDQIIKSKLPFKFITICLQKPPSKVFLNHTFLALYNLTFNKEYCEILLENGVLTLCTGKWVKDFEVDSVTIQNGAATMYNVLKNLDYRLTPSVEEQCIDTWKYLKANRPSVKEVVDALEKFRSLLKLQKNPQKALQRQQKLQEQSNKQKKETEKRKYQRQEQERESKEKEILQGQKEKQKKKEQHIEEEEEDDEYEDEKSHKSKNCLVM
ncbi:hypothetical protein RFI_15209 [Reticulomyxa filosa]|uniref:Uncharacterized protein n=1 Tax=Reticulomyxa filosa TaxID=46433 RepID=X6N7V6_RETFI|nr:hypothetical protein RFI_15209 [Reticulomyxa filosa]|eukprot:ETO21993.1 hypothetical protein RFI_15209 [Reticulomyxa filosa]